VFALDLPHARRLAFGVVLAQAAVTVTAALLTWGFADRRTALSAFLGGGIATLGSLVMAGLVFGGGRGRDPQRVLGAFYLGEAVKVALVIVLFVVVLKLVNVAPLAMFLAFAATFLVYWIALIGALPSLGGRRPSAGRMD
jgi:ATP synthase protein I